MANSVDLDQSQQTLIRSHILWHLIWVNTVFKGLSVPILRIITICKASHKLGIGKQSRPRSDIAECCSGFTLFALNTGDSMINDDNIKQYRCTGNGTALRERQKSPLDINGLKHPLKKLVVFSFNPSLAKHDMSCLSKQCRSRSVGF